VNIRHINSVKTPYSEYSERNQLHTREQHSNNKEGEPPTRTHSHPGTKQKSEDILTPRTQVNTKTFFPNTEKLSGINIPEQFHHHTLAHIFCPAGKRPRQPSPHTAHLIKQKDRTLYNYGPLSRRALIHTSLNLTLKFVQDKARNIEISTPRVHAMHIIGF